MVELVNLKEVLELLKINKIEHFKQGELEIKFAPDAFISELTPPSNPGNTADDEDLLFLSSGVRVKRGEKGKS